jgi:hypothetical protein
MPFYIVAFNAYNEAMTAANFTTYLVKSHSEKNAINMLIESKDITIMDRIVSVILACGKKSDTEENKKFNAIHDVLRNYIDNNKNLSDSKNMCMYTTVLSDGKKHIRKFLRGDPRFYIRKEKPLE